MKKAPLSCAKLKLKAVPCPAMWWQEMKDGIDVLEGKLRQILLSYDFIVMDQPGFYSNFYEM